MSGSGVANTVMLGSVGVADAEARRLSRRRWRARSCRRPASARSSVRRSLGAAAFIIAEFLKISYLQVLVMATIPSLLYFLVDLPDDRGGHAPRWARGRSSSTLPSLWELTRRQGYHFLSLVGLAIMLALGMSRVPRGVLVDRRRRGGQLRRSRANALWPRRLILATGGGRHERHRRWLATTATAGIIVGVVTLTGLGLKIAGLIVALAGGQLFLTVLYSALAVLVLGLAVPVTASYIIAAVMVAPAMIAVGVPDVAAHMFIFYYAVLSEVSPPTALSPFAAAAITGGTAVADDDADVEVHAAGVRVSVRVHAEPAGAGPADARRRVGDIVTSVGDRGARGHGARGRARRLDPRAAPTSLRADPGRTAGGLLLFYAGP